MVRYIATGTLDWADEIDITYSHVYSADERKTALKKLNFIKKVLDHKNEDEDDYEYYDPDDFIVSCYIGTNEDKDISLTDTIDYIQNMTKITESEYNVLSRLGLDDFGPDMYKSFIEDDDVSDWLEDFNKRKSCKKAALSEEEKDILKKQKQLQQFKDFLNKD